MQKLLTDIQTRLLTAIPALKYVDEDWNQLDEFADFKPVQWPCALIDATNATWSNTGKHVQLGLVQITIKIGDMKLTNTSGKAPTGQKTAAFGIYTLYANVFKALHGWSGDASYSHLIRVSESKKQANGLRVKTFVFTCELTDASAAPVKPNISFKGGTGFS